MSAGAPSASPEDVVDFWRAAGPDKWFAKDTGFDAAIRVRFLDLAAGAARGDRDGWAGTPQGALALLILLDQVPRNIFRDEARAFAADAKAREIAAAALARGFDRAVEPALRQFLYLPFVHSEAPVDQERAVLLFETLDDATALASAREHRDIIARFGRFPHRNWALGRTMTEEEQRFLDAGGFAG